MIVSRYRSAQLLSPKRLAAAVTCALLLALGSAAPKASAATVFHSYYGLKEAVARPFEGNFGPLPWFGSTVLDQSDGHLFTVKLSNEIEVGAPGRVRLPAITGAATPAGSFAFAVPTAITIDETGGPTNGDLFVADSGHNVVDILKTNGEYVRQLTGSGTPAGSFSKPSGIAFDSSGNLYVTDRGHDVIDKFEIGINPVSDSDYVSQLSAPQLTDPGSIAIDPNDNLYVSNYHSNFVKFNGSGTYMGTIGPHGDVSEVRIDPVHGWVLFVAGPDIPKHGTLPLGESMSGVFITDYLGQPIWPERIPSEPVHQHLGEYPGSISEGVTDEYATGFMYNSGGAEAYGPELNAMAPTFHAPDVSLQGISNLRGNELDISGFVGSAGGGPTRCQFEVFKTFTYGGRPVSPNIFPCSPKGPFEDENAHPVSAHVSELEPDTTYIARLEAGNEVGTNATEVIEFHTAVVVHDLKTTSASEVGQTTATLNGTFEGTGEDVHYYFEWGKSPRRSFWDPPPRYGTMTPVPPGADAGSAFGNVSVSVPLNNLEPNTTYHFRVIVVTALGKAIGNDKEFTTRAGAPAVDMLAQSVHSDSAELLAHIDSRGAETSYRIEYGEGDCSVTKCQVIAAGATEGADRKELALHLQGLSPTTTYHFRAVAQNFYESTFGERGPAYYGGGFLLDPKGIAVDAQGNVWVVDSENNRVQEFTPSGDFKSAFGTEGTGPGQFSDPNAIAVDSEGNLWVADAGNHRIQEFNPKGEVLLTFGGPGSGDGQFTSVRGIAVSPSSGDVYVAADGRVQQFSSKGEYLGQWGTAGTGNGQFDHLAGIASDAEGHVWTIESGVQGTVKPRVQEFSSAGVFLKKAEFAEGSGAGQLSSPQALSIDSEGNIWIADTANARIAEFDGDGEFIRQMGSYWQAGVGNGNGQFVSADWIANDAFGNVWVTDSRVERIEEFSANGRIVSTPDETFTTFPRLNLESDPCANAQQRQQTGAGQLMDCRAYELVSPPSAGGYDVESDLVPGQTPYDGAPFATSPPRVLYTVHNGALPGIGNAPNYERDPYVATRTSEGWVNEYIGVPAGLPGNAQPYGSMVEATDEALNAFSFGGTSLCTTCFSDGSRGVPLRLKTGSLVQGMKGDEDPGAGAEPAGEVRAPLSGDGSHFVFGSTAKFEADGNSNGDTTIYDRNLGDGITRVVSKTPLGATMTGKGIGELGISQDGSRILVSRKVGEDANKNSLYRLYLNIADSGKTIELTPGANKGVLFDGMTSNGSSVFFTSTEQLLPADSDNSADIYEADINGEGGLELKLVSTGSNGAGNSDACSPTEEWNGVGGCGAVAIGGGGGVAGKGTVFFVSPEKLDGSGKQNEPNLFVAGPGEQPTFIATLRPTDPTVVDAVRSAATRTWGDFQASPAGTFGVFPSGASLTGFHNDGFSEVYRYDVGAQQLDCVSCAPTNVIPTTDAYLPTHGLGITEDGRVFFTSGEALAPGDSNGNVKDAYEWENGVIDLISSGISPFDSGLFSVSADGVDAYLFTRETLVRNDLNGDLMKLYDARHLGGSLLYPPAVPCQAADECHGPSSATPPSPNIGTYEGSGGNVTPEPKCKHGKVLRKGHCVRKPGHQRNRKHPSRHHRSKRGGNHG